MEHILQIIPVLIVFFGTINLLRMAAFRVGSDLYELKMRMKDNTKDVYIPSFSVIIPAHNEQKSVLKTIASVIAASYKGEVQIILVDDGSSDSTLELVKSYKLANNIQNLKIISQENLGKAHALNNGMRNATGEFVMCLDGDSYLERSAIEKTVAYFQDPKVMAVASNIKIIRTKGILNLVQMYEYLVSYQMKRAQSLFNIEYIIGGIGSTFRRGYIEEIGFYDANTVTEDIDITMKILKPGNKVVKAVYGADVISYTQGAINIKDLIKQRFRWKWGRYQTFFKNKDMFFTTRRTFTKGLTWFYLPFALWSDFAFFFEPFVIAYILAIVILYRDIFTIASAFIVTLFYLSLNILAEDTTPIKTKLRLLLVAPAMYILFYILSIVEYVALVRAFIKIPRLKKSLRNNYNSWKPIKRLGFQTS